MTDDIDTPEDTEASPPPTIGLALGGGVARGWAHIGVMRRLDELGVKPDIICGTSVGALVGGFWLANKLDALEEWARALSKRRMLGYFDLMMNGSGLIGGKRLRSIMSDYLGDTQIEDLPGRFTAVTTELATGHEVWIRDGSLVDAIEASYALPGVFPPHARKGRWLIDGALVNPMPVSACRALGARMVLAVGLHAGAFGKASAERKEKYENTELVDHSDIEKAAGGGRLSERLMLRRLFRANGNAPGMGAVMLASFHIVMDRITRSRLAGDPPDVQIMPQAGHIGLLDFDRADELIALGREAVDYSLPRINASMDILK